MNLIESVSEEFPSYSCMVTWPINSKQNVGRAGFFPISLENILYVTNALNVNVMRQSASVMVNLITVTNFAPLFNSTPVDRASDSIMSPI